MTSGWSFFGFLASSATRQDSICSEEDVFSNGMICSGSVKSGFSQEVSSSRGSYTGSRSWYAPTTGFGDVVMMVKVWSSVLVLGSVHGLYRPAKAMMDSFSLRKQYHGCGGFGKCFLSGSKKWVAGTMHRWPGNAPLYTLLSSSRSSRALKVENFKRFSLAHDGINDQYI
jgi:hypothetical protein